MMNQFFSARNCYQLKKVQFSGVRLKRCCETLLLNWEGDGWVASSALLCYQKTRPPRLLGSLFMVIGIVWDDWTSWEFFIMMSEVRGDEECWVIRWVMSNEMQGVRKCDLTRNWTWVLVVRVYELIEGVLSWGEGELEIKSYHKMSNLV